MDWIKRINRALDYVENNLDNRLEIKDIADQANTSSFHFQRMFSILTNITLAEYIRRRRLTIAAKEILAGSGILETALKFGYESQASFTRAYSRMHGFSPGLSRNTGRKIKAYPPLTIQISIRGELSMDYEIRTQKSFYLTGPVRKFSTKNKANFRDIPEFWKKFKEDGSCEKLMKLTDTKGCFRGALLGICLQFNENQEEFDYMIGVEPSDETALFENKSVYVPELTWAVFSGKGRIPEALQNTWHRIFAEWFPATEYIHDQGPEIEVYLPEGSDKEEMSYEIHIPVRKG